MNKYPKVLWREVPGNALIFEHITQDFGIYTVRNGMHGYCVATTAKEFATYDPERAWTWDTSMPFLTEVEIVVDDIGGASATLADIEAAVLQHMKDKGRA